MTKRALAFVTSAVFAALAGCGGPSHGSCTAQQMGSQLCIEFSTNSTAVTVDQVRQQCLMQTGATYSAGGCAGANVVGRCVQSLSNTTMSLTQTYFFYQPFSTEIAMQFCTRLNGTWQGG
ncbi:MAG: hypothetical protein JNK05_23580 [Myxococcales bacterium]|nr:hypothetical protein [Myxococcales bacterium]